jgi:chromosome segregation ATPase
LKLFKSARKYRELEAKLQAKEMIIDLQDEAIRDLQADASRNRAIIAELDEDLEKIDFDLNEKIMEVESLTNLVKVLEDRIAEIESNHQMELMDVQAGFEEEEEALYTRIDDLEQQLQRSAF